MFCHVEPEQVRRAKRRHSRRLFGPLSDPPSFPPRPVPGHLCARRVVHLQSAAAAGAAGRGGLPQQETQHAHRDSAQEDADKMEGDVRQVSLPTDGNHPPPLFYVHSSCRPLVTLMFILEMRS